MITKHNGVRQMLPESEDRYRALFERSMDAVYIHDLKGNFLDANDVALRLLGYSRDELVELSFTDLLDVSQVPAAFVVLQEIMENGYQAKPTIFKLKRKDGTLVEVETVAAVITNEGQSVAIQGIAREITERQQQKQTLDEPLRRSARTEDALQRFGEELSRITDCLPLAFAYINSEQRYCFTNKEYEDWVQRTRDEIMGRHVREILGEQVYEVIQGRVEAVLSGEQVMLETTLPYREKGSRDVVVTYSPDIGERGEVEGFFVFITDVTEHKQAEEALRASKVLLERTFGSLDEVILVVEPTSRTIIACNPAAERVFGYTEKEILGRNTEFLHVDRAMYEEFGRKLFPALDANGVFRTEYQARRKDRTVIATEHTVTEIVDESGHRTGLVSVIRDITERKNAEALLRESEEQFRSLYMKTPGILHSIDTDGNLVTVSDRWLEVFGYERNEVIGRKAVEFLTAESRHYEETVSLPEFWKTGWVQDVPYQFVTKTGETVDILLSAIAQRDDAGNVVRSLAVLNDITERKRLEEELRQAREALEGRVERQMLHKNPYRLTFREFTVLHFVAAGKADKEIAHELGISPLTVHKHVANILGKMNAASRTEAGVRALREGLVD